MPEGWNVEEAALMRGEVSSGSDDAHPISTNVQSRLRFIVALYFYKMAMSPWILVRGCNDVMICLSLFQQDSFICNCERLRSSSGKCPAQ